VNGVSTNYGKKFEEKFKGDFLKLDGSSLDRLYDTMNGYKSIKQISDFIGYVYPNIFYLECKSHKGASVPLSNITQYDNLKKKIGIPGVRSGVVLWLYEKDKVFYIPAKTLVRLKEGDGEKSVGLRHVDKYRMIEIPSDKKRVFMDSDYSVLLQLVDGD
jgi:penicillin-binding protein-related factor A (putative recombinase)